MVARTTSSETMVLEGKDCELPSSGFLPSLEHILQPYHPGLFPCILSAWSALSTARCFSLSSTYPKCTYLSVQSVAFLDINHESFFPHYLIEYSSIGYSISVYNTKFFYTEKCITQKFSQGRPIPGGWDRIRRIIKGLLNYT